MQAKPSTNRLRSIGWTLLLVPFLLLPYRWLFIPCGLAGMVLARPNGESMRTVLSRDSTLIFGSALVLLVRTGLDVGWWLPWLPCLAVLMLLRASRWWRPSLGYALLIVVPLAAVLFLLRPSAWPWRTGDDMPSSSLTIICAGDSLTSGVKPGTDAGTYVANLRERWPCQVINAGVASDRTADLLARLDRTVLVHRPDVVLLFIGGNDYLDGTPRSVFAAALDQVAGRISESGARLVIVEVPSGIIWNPYAGVYRRTARRYGAELVPETKLRWWYSVELLLRDQISDPLTVDGIHLSSDGAAKVAEWLAPYIIHAGTDNHS